MQPTAQDRQNFESAVEAHAESIYRVAFRLTGNADCARELVQETYLGAWKNMAQLQDKTKLRNWIFGILRNQYAKYCYRSRRETFQSAQLDEIPQVLPSSFNLQEQVQDALGRLEDDFRLPLLLTSMEGWTTAEAAEFLDIPLGTLLSRLHRGREKLRQLLEPEFPERVKKQ